MNKLKMYFSLTLVSMGILYALMSLINFSFNPQTWKSEFLVVFAVIEIALFVMGVASYYDEIKKLK